MHIQANETLGVVIDIQEKLFPHMFASASLLSNTIQLIKGLKILQIPLLLTEQYPKGLGATVPGVLQELAGTAEAIEKNCFSSCKSPPFRSALVAMNRKTVLLAGIESHICVQQTALDLLESGYRPVVVTDCVSSRKVHDRDTAFLRLSQEGALLATLESVLFEICAVAGTETFKAISRLVK